MTAPAGACEWCGGPQWWSVHAGVMYVKCQSGCVSLFPEDRVNFLPDSELGENDEWGPRFSGSPFGTIEEGEGVTCEGSEASKSGNQSKDASGGGSTKGGRECLGE